VTSYEIGDAVAWLEAETADVFYVYASRLPDGPPVALGGTGGLIFTAIEPGGTLEDILQRVAGAAEIDPEEIRPDVTSFVAELVTLGLVTER
jgi:hypothetical protein